MEIKWVKLNTKRINLTFDKAWFKSDMKKLVKNIKDNATVEEAKFRAQLAVAKAKGAAAAAILNLVQPNKEEKNE